MNPHAVQLQVDFWDAIRHNLVAVQHCKVLLDLWQVRPWMGMFTEWLFDNHETIDSAPFCLAALLVLTLWITFGEDSEPFKDYPGAEVCIYIMGCLLFIGTCLLQIERCVVVMPVDYLWLCNCRLDELRKKRLNFDKCSLFHALRGTNTPEPAPGTPLHELPLLDKQLLAYSEYHFKPSRIFTFNATSLAAVKASIEELWKFGSWAVRDLTSWYYIALNAASLIALMTSEKQLFCFCFILLDYFRRRGGQQILQSVYQGAPGLLGSARVAIVIIMIYACVTFWAFQSEVEENNPCSTAYQCILLGINAGLYGDLGPWQHGDNFGNIMQTYPEAIDDKSKKQLQLLFVMSFLMIWNYILSGIVQGYIVVSHPLVRIWYNWLLQDAFSTMRSAESLREQDSQNNCLVCSLSKFELQRHAAGLKVHVEEHHNRWSYLYLATMVHLSHSTDVLGTTGNIVRQAIEQNSTDFIPLRTTYEMTERSSGTIESDDDVSGTSNTNEFESIVNSRLASLEGATSNIQAQLRNILDKVDSL